MPVCSLCGSLDTTPTPCAFPGIVKCVKCKFIFAAVTTDSSDPELYDESWARAGLHPTYVYWKGEYVLRNRWRHEALLRRLEPFRKCNRLLDVGCSAAFFLKLAQEYGWGVQGVELSDFGVKYSREVLGVDVFQGLLEDAAFPDGSFDAAFSSHVIEHIADPRTFLREMRRIVRPAGALITTLPTQFAGLGYRIFGELTGDGPPVMSRTLRKTHSKRCCARKGSISSILDRILSCRS